MVLQVYVDARTMNCRKVLAGLDLIGLPFETHHVDFSNDEHKSPAYLAINPNGSLPGAVDGDLRLFESNAILMYAADLADAPTAYPREPAARADANCWLLWEQSAWFGPNYAYMTENVFKPLGGESADAAVLAEAASAWHRRAAVLEARLASTGAWILEGPAAAGAPSIVDVVMGAAMHGGPRQGLPLEDYPQIRRWWAELQRQPCWVNTQGVVDKSLNL